MSEHSEDLSAWIGSGESLEGLEDRDFEFAVEEAELPVEAEYIGPCGGCTECATGSHPIGANLENIESGLDIVEVSFKGRRSGFYINETGAALHIGTPVITGAERGIDLGKVITITDNARMKRRSRGLVSQPMRKVLRTANEDDVKRREENKQVEDKAVGIFKEKCAKHQLAMKLVEVEYQFDRSRITFYFTADFRVDFRSLVRDLASVYKTRIELRQIGARDEAKKVGGIGVCGKEVCCTTWMSQLKRVTLDHARFQSLSLNPSRLAGACGRLKCCILFEVQHYLDALKDFPPLNSKVVTGKGEGYIEKIDVLKEQVYLKYSGTGISEAVSLAEIKSQLILKR